MEKKLKIDIGCGKHKEKDFVGIDVDKSSDADIIASALDLPLESNSVDEVNCSHLVEHFSPAETHKFFSEIYRVMKKNAKAFIKIDKDWTKKKLLAKDSTHKHRYSVKEIKKILSLFDFSQIKVARKVYLINLSLRTKLFVELVK